jgi:hypothetical protein
MSNEPEVSNQDSASNENPTAKHHATALAIQSFEKKYETAQSGRAGHERKVLRWTQIAGIGVAVYTFVTVVIMGASIYSAKQARISADAAQTAVKIASDRKSDDCAPI